MTHESLYDWEIVEQGDVKEARTKPPQGDVVTFDLSVIERIRYPAQLDVRRGVADRLFQLFPEYQEKGIPVQVLLAYLEQQGEPALIVSNERHGDVQGQEPSGRAEVQQ